MLLRAKEKYEPVMSHLQLMIKSYIQEVGLMDMDIATVLKKKSTAVPKEASKYFEKLNPRMIYKEGWFVVYQLRERIEVDFHKSSFYLKDKHLYNTACLELILDPIISSRATTRMPSSAFLI
ncbi:unnamed protein product [Lactuca saligna]|uniref:Uncharacterized protein n=1 Tax=Lactuca saligna TaxID=75948 RepID=A0AA35YMZ4_LACSI|nr:unnamed protein product [Lactuca saligna]